MINPLEFFIVYGVAQYIPKIEVLNNLSKDIREITMNFADNRTTKKKIITTLSLVFIISVHLNAQIVEIPFELKNDLILLKVNINDDSEYKTFVFDTGATSDLLDSTTAEKLGLKANYKQDVSGAGGTKSYDIILYQKLTLQNKIVIDSTHLILTNLTI